MNKQTFPVRYFFPILKLSFPQDASKGDVHTSFVQEEPLDLQCLFMIWATCVVGDVSIRLHILTLEF